VAAAAYPCPRLCAYDFAAHRIRRPPVPPPKATASCGYKQSAPPMSSPFSTSVIYSCATSVFSSRRVDANWRTLVHRAPPPPATTQPDRHLLELHLVSLHLGDPSSSDPDNPSGPSPSLLPARRPPPLSLHGQPAPASLRLIQPHPEHCAAEYDLPAS
jgi:hypothetical protein